MYLKIISGRAQDRAILLSSRIHPILEVLALKVCSISSHTSLFFLVLASWFVCNVLLPHGLFAMSFSNGMMYS